MDKEGCLENLLNTLRVAITTASVYFKEHPNFLKAVQDLKNSIDAALKFVSPIKIAIAVNSLLIEGKAYANSKVYQELASNFHRRKIKNIKIAQDATKEELVIFLSSASLPVKELIKKGGLKQLLIKEKCTHILVDELDYSQLLKAEGSQDKEVWAYLLEEALEEDSLNKINEFADNFEGLIKKIRPKDFIQDQELKQSVGKFLAYLKAKEEEKFNKCAKEILKSVIKDKNISSQEEIKELNVFINELDEKDLADSLWDEILTDNNFDALSFSLFFRLIDEKKHDKIASLLAQRHNKWPLVVSQEIKKKVKDLFSVPESSLYSEAYKHAFDFFLKDVAFEEKGFSFNRENLYINYRFVLLNLFSFEEDKYKLNLIKERIFSEWEKIIQGNDFEYLKYLLEIIHKRYEVNPGLKEALDEVESRVASSIENIAFSKELVCDLSYFVDNLKAVTFDSKTYLDKIFKEDIVNPLILKLFFKFFPQGLPLFCDRLNKKGPNIEFSIAIIDSLKKIDSPSIAEVLKTIFYLSNNFVKLEILKSMRGLKNVDEYFLLDILIKENILLKREALLVLKNSKKLTRNMLDSLFAIKGGFGRKNNILIENISLIEELGLKEAKDYLVLLSKRPFFWNRKLRRKAREALRKIGC